MKIFSFKEKVQKKENGSLILKDNENDGYKISSGLVYIKELNDGSKAVFQALNTEPTSLPDKSVFWMQLNEFQQCQKNTEKMLDKIQSRYETYHEVPLDRVFAKKYLKSYKIFDRYVWFHL